MDKQRLRNVCSQQKRVATCRIAELNCLEQTPPPKTFGNPATTSIQKHCMIATDLPTDLPQGGGNRRATNEPGSPPERSENRPVGSAAVLQQKTKSSRQELFHAGMGILKGSSYNARAMAGRAEALQVKHSAAPEASIGLPINGGPRLVGASSCPACRQRSRALFGKENTVIGTARPAC